jgi:hypothetical protein
VTIREMVVKQVMKWAGWWRGRGQKVRELWEWEDDESDGDDQYGLPPATAYTVAITNPAITNDTCSELSRCLLAN